MGGRWQQHNTVGYWQEKKALSPSEHHEVLLHTLIRQIETTPDSCCCNHKIRHEESKSARSCVGYRVFNGISRSLFCYLGVSQTFAAGSEKNEYIRNNVILNNGGQTVAMYGTSQQVRSVPWTQSVYTCSYPAWESCCLPTAIVQVWYPQALPDFTSWYGILSTQGA